MFDAATYDYLERETISEWIPIDETFVDRYQRIPQEAKINAMCREDVFDPDALGSVVLSLRNKGDRYAGLYAIVDGNHRVHCCRKLGISHVYARVLIDKSYEEEAELFDKLNRRSRITAYHQFVARVERKEPKALAMRQLLAVHDLKLAARNDGLGAISAVNAMDRLYDDLGPKGFAQVVDVLHRAWGKESRAWISAIIDGIKQFWIRYSLELDADRLVDRLRLIHPEDILRNAQVGLVKRGTAGSRVGRQIHDHYNTGLRRSRLPDWVDHPGKGVEGRGRSNPGIPDDDDPPARGPSGRRRR